MADGTQSKRSTPETHDGQAGKPVDANPPSSGLKLLIELTPLLVFFGAYAKFGIKPATGILMVVTVLSLIASKLLLGHASNTMLVTTALVVIFGTLTFALDDPRFIKMKPTAVNLLLAGALGYGLATGRNFLKSMMGEALSLTDIGWRKLTVRWIGFFIALAVLNEVIVRTMSEAAWVNFKVFGILPLSLVFGIAQIGLITRHTATTPGETNA